MTGLRLTPCPSCGTNVIVATSQITGIRMPIDPQPADQGNIELHLDGTYTVLGGDPGLLTDTKTNRPGKRHLPHSATCAGVTFVATDRSAP